MSDPRDISVKDTAGLEALANAVGALRTKHVGCNALNGTSSCPWAVTWTEDIEALYCELASAGYQITPRREVPRG